MPLVQTRGAASAQGFGEFAQVTAANYIEDVFSTYLYTGTNSAITINNGIDLSTKGGLVWIKCRNQIVGNRLWDTVRGGAFQLGSQDTDAQAANAGTITFNTNGFSTQSALENSNNRSGYDYASWTFREQPKFFDVVTYTGTGSNTTIAHSLGVVPGSIIVKRTDTAAAWAVYHRSLANTQYLVLNTTAAAATGATWWNSTTPTSSVFSLGTDASVNASAGTYIAYIFAHNAGGFGLTGTDNVISCGSYTGNGSSTGPVVNLGYEPQFIILKAASGGTSGAQDWNMIDNMRGWTTSSNQQLNPNLSAAETSQNNIALNATGFQPITAGADFNGNGNTYIYIAIRRGPMKVPTTGTSVFSPITAAADPSNVSVGFPTDLFLANKRSAGSGKYALSRLTGGPQYLTVTSADAEVTYAGTKFDLQNNFTSAVLYGSISTISYMFGRAPGFFDEVCYTGTGVNRTLSHNLTVVPELMIVKGRSIAERWSVYSAPTTATTFLILDGTTAATTNNFFWNDTAPTSSVFTVGTQARVNNSGDTYIAYLFASAPGVSKVGSYTGTATTLQIDCGFTAGARFVLIKRTDSTGDWYVWDSARGIIAGDDPYLLLNSTAAEVTNTDYIDTYSAGFEISSTAPAAINANGGSFIFLAIA